MRVPFTKMNGAGNDFVIFDSRENPIQLTGDQVKKIAARNNPITKGCDQVIVMENSKAADVFMRIYNADGGEVDSCGNATRCVAWLQDIGDVTIETKAGMLESWGIDEDKICVDMGEPRLQWQQIPLAEAQDTLHVNLSLGGISDPVAVSMGNPHAVFIVDDVSRAPVKELGPQLEHHPLFPQRANISFAQVVSPSEINLRVWERGAGETLACGTAACATLVALHRRGLVDHQSDIHLPGGTLHVDWDKETNHVWMTGPVEIEFEGELEL